MLAQATTESKNRALRAIAGAIRATSPLSSPRTSRTWERIAADWLDRLRLTSERVAAMAHDVEAVAELDDPVGDDSSEHQPNGSDFEAPRAAGGCRCRV